MIKLADSGTFTAKLIILLVEDTSAAIHLSVFIVWYASSPPLQGVNMQHKKKDSHFHSAINNLQVI